MKFLFSIFFGAGLAAWVYTKMGRRLGYANQGNVWTIVGVTFVLSTIIFYTILALFISSS